MSATKVVRTLRLSESVSRRLTERAARSGTSSTALLDRLIREGIEQLEHPGIVFRGPMNDRRATLTGGPEVWEVVARVQELTGTMQHRVQTLSASSGLPSDKIETAMAYARDHGMEVIERIGRDHRAAKWIRRATEIQLGPEDLDRGTLPPWDGA